MCSASGAQSIRDAHSLDREAAILDTVSMLTTATANAASLNHATGAEVRRRARSGELRGPTPGLALGYVQANLVVVPRDQAFDFLLFCQRNPKPCPLLDVTECGSAEPVGVAPHADLRTDLPC